MSPGRDRWRVVLWLFALLAAGNGAWMLASTEGWFRTITPDVSPFNLHFVRDVGVAFVTVGVALGFAAARPGLRGPMTVVAAVFLGLHALGHVRETLAGDLGPHHWVEDLPGVYLPALVITAMAVHFMRRPEREGGSP